MSEIIEVVIAKEARRLKRAMEDEKRLVALMHGHNFNTRDKQCLRCGMPAWKYHLEPTPRALCDGRRSV